ncbi:amiloride-sensitive sodium channel subunit beta-like isoform X2 [Ostrea edulis]|uniref:amiloride-sensitive sodium channel subunit beta-like isoform X2 n=2 Tax=Ostrea edulis TaxID=37623 RepID=UPI0024AF68A9|nr:amiloride-sensitive sodium channel subunit beta-like isoform X2 [Ostrea edulis]
MILCNCLHLPRSYMEPTNTAVKNRYGELEFPKVSFCNLNPMKFSKMVEKEKLFRIINETAALTKVDILDFGIFVEKYVKQYLPSAPLGIQSTSDAKNLFYLAMGELSALDDVAQPIKEFIVSCEYQGQPCDQKDLVSYRDEFYGVCYKFVPLKQPTVASPGPQMGLTLTLNVEEHEYIPFITGSAGVIMDIARIQNSEMDRIPIMKTTGILMSPNVETNIALQNTEHIRLPGASKKCASDMIGGVAECIETCVGTVAAKLSGCAHEITYMVGTVGMCETLREIEENEYVRVHLDIGSSCTHCKIPCFEHIHEKTISMTSWPIDSYIPILKNQLKESGVNITVDTQLDTSSLLKIHVFFSTLATTIIEEEKAYTFGNFLSDIGGQLGLWAGISVLSLAEVLELLVLIVVGFCTRKNKTANEVESIKDLKTVSN